MILLLNKLKSFRINKTIFYLFIVIGASQTIAMLFQLVLRNFYTPTDFGYFSTYSALSGMLVSISSGRIEQAILIEKHERNAIEVLWLSIFISILFSIVLFLLFLFFKNIICSIFGIVDHKSIIFLLPLTIILFSCCEILNNLLIRREKFISSGINKIIRRITEGITQLSFYPLKSPFGLVLGEILGQVSNIFSSFYQLRKVNLFKFNPLRWKYFLKKHSDFIFHNTPSTFINNLCAYYQVFYITSHFSKQELGIYDLSRFIVLFPISLLILTIQPILLQKISYSIRENIPLKTLFTKYIIFSFFFSLIFLLGIYIFDDFILLKFFNKSWEGASKFIEIIIFSALIKLIVSPLSNYLIVIKHLKIIAFWQYSYFALCCILFAISFSSIIVFLKISVLLDIIFYSFYLFLIFRSYRQTNNLIEKKSYEHFIN